jgi:hypothetical protein
MKDPNISNVLEGREKDMPSNYWKANGNQNNDI